MIFSSLVLEALQWTNGGKTEHVPKKDGPMHICIDYDGQRDDVPALLLYLVLELHLSMKLLLKLVDFLQQILQLDMKTGLELAFVAANMSLATEMFHHCQANNFRNYTA